MNTRFLFAPMLILIATATFAVPAAPSDAASQNVVVLYDGRTATNAHAIQFLYEYMRRHGTRYQMNIMSLSESGSFDPADYRAVVVLSTG